MYRKVKKIGILLSNISCNADCYFCAGKVHRVEKFNLDFFLYKKVLDQANSIESLSISGGGEPLLETDKIKELLIFLKPYKIKKINLYTNGILIPKLKKELREWKGLGLTHAYISFHSVDHVKNGKIIRANQNFPKWKDIIKTLKSVDLKIRANIIVHEKGIHTLDKLKQVEQFVLKIGFNYFSSWVIRNEDDSRNQLYNKFKDYLDLEESEYKNQKVTIFPDGTVSSDWC